MSHSVAFKCGPLQHLHKRVATCSHAIQRQNVFFARSPMQQRSHRGCLQIRAKEDGEEKGKKIDDRKKTEQTNKLVEGMKKGGIDQSTAQRILDTWEKTGATSTDALRKMLLGRSLKTVGVVLFQLLLDGGAAYGSYNSARSVPKLVIVSMVALGSACMPSQSWPPGWTSYCKRSPTACLYYASEWLIPYLTADM